MVCSQLECSHWNLRGSEYQFTGGSQLIPSTLWRKDGDYGGSNIDIGVNDIF